MSGTTVAAAKAWLYGQLPAAIGDSEVVVAYDQPSALTDDLVIVGDVKDGVAFKAARGAASAAVLEESYELTVTVDVYRGGDDFKTVFERCAALVDAVAAPVRADPKWGGALTSGWGLPSQVDYQPAWADDDNGNHLGARCMAVVTFACHARI